MATVFCRVTAELSPDFMQKFSCQFDVNAMLSKICEDNNLDISYQNENLFIHGDWTSVGCAHNMLVSTLAVYGSPSEMKNKSLASRPFSALVEAAEAISREVELQEQVKNESKFRMASASNLQEIKSDIGSMKSEDDLSNSSVSEGNEKNESTVYDDAKLSKSIDMSSSDSLLSVTEERGTPEVNEQKENGFNSNKTSAEQDLTIYNSGDSVLNSERNVFSNSMLVTNFKHEPVDIDSKSKGRKIISVLKKAKINGLYECDKCQKQYKKWKSLVVHMKFHNQISVKQETSGNNAATTVLPNSNKESPTKIEEAAKNKRFLCQTCGKSYTTKHTLLQHVNAHLGIKPYQCTVCGKAFTYETALRDHRFTHNDAKYFVCQYPKCEKSFRQRSALKTHEKIHADVKQFCCSECGRGFTQKHALQRHERSHKGQKPFKCKLCGRMFGDSSIARRHIKLVHKLNKDLGVWREDIEEVTEDDKADINQIAGEEMAANEQTQSVEVTEVRANMLETGEERADLVHAQIDIATAGKDTEIQSHTPDSANNIQSVFVNYNLPEHNIVSDPSQEFQDVVPVVQHAFKPFIESTSKFDRQDNTKAPITNNLSLIQPEQETYVIERDQIHFLTENLDGTLNTSTIDFSRLKRNLEHMSKPNIGLDINAVSDQFGETLKPDGTVAELPMDNSFENMSKYSDNDQLSEHLGLSMPQFQFYSSSSVNQYFNMNQSSMMPGLPSTETAPSD